MAKRKSKPIKVYKVTLGTGALIFVKAKDKGEARTLSEDEMTKIYGKVKYIASILEATEQDREDFPVFFGKLRASRLNPGTNWHVDRAEELRKTRSRVKHIKSEEWNRLNDRVLENELAADASRKVGMNPMTYQEYIGKRVKGLVKGGHRPTAAMKIAAGEWRAVKGIPERQRTKFLPSISKGLTVPKKCEYDFDCPGKVTHFMQSKYGDFFVCTKHAKEAEEQRGVRYIEKIRQNPGAAWHRHEADDSRRMVGTAFARDNNLQRYYKGKASAHIMSEIVSNQQGMPNPGRKIPWIPLLAGAGLIWLIWRNRKSTVQAVKK